MKSWWWPTGLAGWLTTLWIPQCKATILLLHVLRRNFYLYSPTFFNQLFIYKLRRMVALVFRLLIFIFAPCFGLTLYGLTFYIFYTSVGVRWFDFWIINSLYFYWIIGWPQLIIESSVCFNLWIIDLLLNRWFTIVHYQVVGLLWTIGFTIFISLLDTESDDSSAIPFNAFCPPPPLQPLGHTFLVFS